MVDVGNSPDQTARQEYDKFLSWNHSQYLPKMKSTRVLGAIDEEGQPRDPIYAIGAVVEKGVNLPSGRNHAEYVDVTGYYDIVKFLDDHRNYFPGLENVGIGQLCPHVTSKVDCESLFSSAGHVSDPRRSQTDIRLYERLVTTKHRMQHIYCSPRKVHQLFMKRWKDNDWDEKDERDDRAFLELEKAVYLDMCPHNAGIFDNEEEDDASQDEEEVLEVDKDSDDDVDVEDVMNC